MREFFIFVRVLCIAALFAPASVFAGQLKFDDVPVDITTADNEILVVSPGTGGYTQIGTASGTPGYALTNNDLYISGILETKGNAYLNSGLTVSGALNANGNIALGDAAADIITLNGRLGAHVLPSLDSTYNLGSSTLAYSSLYVDTISGYNSALSLNPSSGYSLSGTVVKSASAGDETAYDLAAAINKAAGSYTGLKLNVTEAAAPGIANKLLDLQTGGLSSLQVYSGSNSVNYGLLSLGNGVWDGVTTGYFQGNAGGTIIAVNIPGGFSGNLMDLQMGGLSRFSVDSAGNVTAAGTISGSGTLGGSGTAGYLSRWTAVHVLGNSIIYDNGTNAGIGTASPGAKLDIVSAAGTIPFKITNLSGTDEIYLAGTAGDSEIISDTNLYIRSAAGGNIFLGANGAQADLAINAGNIGIGNTSPGSLLDVSGTAQLRGTSGGTGLYVNSSGNVGIGTTAPNAFLHVAATASNLFEIQNYSNDIGATAALRLTLSTINPGNVYSEISSIRTDASAGGSSLAFKTMNITSLSERMRIDNYGNVGIGTTAPGYSLEIDKNIASSNNILMALHNLNVSAKGGGIGFFDGTEDANKVKMSFIGTNYSTSDWTKGRLSFSVNDDAIGEPIEHMSILSTGNVGIGTTAPAYTLDVVGNIKASGTIYGGASGTQVPVGTGTADYVPKWSASGTLGNSVVYDNGGNVGIGTTAPLQQLSVNGNIQTSGSIQLGSVSGAGISSLGQIGGVDTYLRSASTGGIGFIPNQASIAPSNYAMYINSSGNVGIGTTGPEGKFVVYKDSGAGVIEANTGFLLKSGAGNSQSLRLLVDGTGLTSSIQ
ncbi:MAG: hypothetical protein PHC33_03650, partial [Candidatus Omnitrophica bacterium]|nr:hypothetical protein [Candidatus Omnitrophota bacterium]